MKVGPLGVLFLLSRWPSGAWANAGESYKSRKLNFCRWHGVMSFLQTLNQTIMIITFDIPMAFNNVRLSNSCSRVLHSMEFQKHRVKLTSGSHYTCGQSDGSLVACFKYFFKDHFKFFAQGGRKPVGSTFLQVSWKYEGQKQKPKLAVPWVGKKSRSDVGYDLKAHADWFSDWFSRCDG